MCYDSYIKKFEIVQEPNRNEQDGIFAAIIADICLRNPNQKEAHTKTPGNEKWNIPQFEIAALARCILPAIQRYYESEDSKWEFDEWKLKQEK